MKPILFNSEMVRAILEGRKTVTRRKVDIDISNKFDVEVDGSVICYIDQTTGDSYKPTDIYRYKADDILYVRETFADTWTPGDDTGYVYKADGQPNSFPYWGNASTCKDEVWRPSIHMPKEAARIFLRVKSVKVERLQSASDIEIEREGIKVECGPLTSCPYCNRVEFIGLWNSTIDKSSIDIYGWDANPWVWVISFEQISKEEAYGTNSDRD